MIPPPSSPPSSESWVSKVSWPLVLQLGGLVLASVVVFVLSARFPLLDWIGSSRTYVEHLGVWSGLIYPFICAGCNLLLLPGGILSVGGGFFFGLWWGFALVMAGNLIGACLAFVIARSLGRRRIERLLHRHQRLRSLDAAIRRHGWKLVVLSQLNPLAPSSLLNYCYGLTSVPLGRCLLWTALGRTPGVFLYAFIGTLGQFSVEVARGVNTPPTPGNWPWLLGFCLTVVTTWLLTRVAQRVLKEVDTENVTTEPVE
jgi:uncharacterized membrane protein YdjX (TVP38/TMEM64 family)